jgi:hypothetical protein
MRAHVPLQQVEGTDIGGLKVALIADTPKVMTEGNWKLGVFVDEAASDDQADRLVQVFSRQLGGPMAALAPLVGEMLGVERTRIEVGEAAALAPRRDLRHRGVARRARRAAPHRSRRNPVLTSPGSEAMPQMEQMP